jgi:glycosyltransferase 2 family protein
MKSVVASLLKAGVTGVLFYLLFRKLKFEEFASTLRNARWEVLLLGILVLWTAHFICTLRWRTLMQPVMPALPVPQLFAIYCIGLFFNLAFPTVIGGDVVKMYYAGKPSRRFVESFATTFLDRDAGMFAMMLIASAATLSQSIAIPGFPVRLIIWGAFAAFLCVNLAIFMPPLHRLFTGILLRLKLARLARKADAVSNVFQLMGRNPLVLVGALLISLLNQLLVITVTWIMSTGLRIGVPFRYFLIFVPVITLIAMVPVSLNGMGLREYAFVSLFGAIGVEHEACLALGLIASAVVILSAIPGGIVYLLFRTKADIHQMAVVESDF